jgi:hypothetical protein
MKCCPLSDDDAIFTTFRRGWVTLAGVGSFAVMKGKARLAPTKNALNIPHFHIGEVLDSGKKCGYPV